MSDRENEADAGGARRARPFAASAFALVLAVALGPATAERAATATRPTVDGDAERAGIEAWRAERVRRLTSDTGWLTLAGLFWLREGENSFGRSSSNALVLDNPSLADAAGSFLLRDHRVRFVARPGGGVTHDAKAVSSLDLVADTQGEPTVLASGSLRFFIIERAGHLGVRVRDLDNPHRRNFRGLSYFPVSTAWVLDARFEPYEPAHRLRIVNILGMEEDAVSPGAVVFTRDGREWRLDTVLESPGDTELFIMFADETSGRETYGAGRFLDIPMPEGRRAQLDFNKAYNPPCALNDFATCPLPPPQNRLKLRIEAGEKRYEGGPEQHHS
jgi:uncharacterized protein (DUF1684 family)